MSGRKLGGGRVLGNSNSLSPAAAVVPKRNSDLLSPSPSSISLDSSASTSHTSTEPQDLASRISLDQYDGGSAAAAASSRLVCPICNEEMVIKPSLQRCPEPLLNLTQVTLLQLNRYMAVPESLTTYAKALFPDIWTTTTRI